MASDYEKAIRDAGHVEAAVRARSALGVTRARAVVAKTTADVEATAKKLAPVDTGALRNSIGSDVIDLDDAVQGVVGPTVNYAGYVEYGTSRMSPQPYLNPALAEHEAAFVAALEQVSAVPL